MGVAPHHEDLGVAGVVDPPVVSLEEEVGLLTSAGGDLIVERIKWGMLAKTDWSHLDETRSNLEFSITRAGTEEGTASSILGSPPDHHETIFGLPDQDVVNGPTVDTILERKN